MRINKQLAAKVAAALALATLFSTSAFADSRPANETRRRSDDRYEGRRDRGQIRSESRRGHDSRSRQPYYANGRISKISPYQSGYRVWVGGARYPFHVPHRYYNRDRFRVGVSINLGGFYNPAGYYDYYDARYDDRAYGRRDRELRGYVERVDYRRDVMVIRDEYSRRLVTVVSRDVNRRVRPGDFVEVEGRWARSGVFEAYDVDRIGRGSRRY